MAALLPFAQNLPQELQVPSLQPDFNQIQQVAQRANTIFETGLHQVKNAYSSVINAPVTSSRNLQKKEEYVHNFREGLKKITKENLRMPQNVQQAENLLSPFWQDQVMLTDMSATAKLQSAYEQYEQAANSSEEKIRSTANSESLEDLNNYAEKLRNAGDDINDYTKLGTPKYLPLDRVNSYMNDMMLADKDDANNTFTSKYVLDQNTGDYARDANGSLIPLPPGELITQTGGMLAVPVKTHLASARIGNRFDPQYELRAKNQYNKAIKMAKQQYPNISDADAESIVNKEFYNTITGPVREQLTSYNGAIDAYRDRIQSLEQQATSSTGLTSKQKDDLDITRLKLKNAEQGQIELVNTLSSLESGSGKVTGGFITNRLANSYRYNDVKEWGRNLAFHNTKSIMGKDEPYFATLEANDRRFGHQLTQQKNIWDMQHDQTQDMISIANSIGAHPELTAYYQARGINIPDMNTSSTTAGIPMGASSSGLATNEQVEYDLGKLYQDMRANNLNKVSDGLWGIQDQNNSMGGLIFALQDKFTTNEFDALRKYQELHQRGGLTYTNDNKQFIPQSVQEGKDYEAAITKLCTLTGKARNTIKSADDITNMVVDMVGTNLSQYMNDGVNQDKIAQYTSAFSRTKSIYDKVRREDDIHNKLVEERAKGNESLYGHALINTQDGKKRLIRESDIPINYGVEGVGEDGKHYSLSAAELRKKYLDGQIEVIIPQYSENQFSEPIIKIDGVSISPTKVGNVDYQTPYEEAHSFNIKGWYPGRGQLAGGTSAGTDPRALSALANDLDNVKRSYGSSSQIAATLATLRNKVVPNEQYYKTLTGETDKFITVPITGDTKIGKETKDNSLNLNYLREAIMPGNNLATENKEGKTVSDEELDKLSQLFNNKTDAVKFVGDSYGYLPSDKLGRRKFAVRVNARPETTTEEKSVYKDLVGKTYYITLSPTAQGTFIKDLAPAPDRNSYDPLLSNDPNVNAEYSNSYQKNYGVDSKLTQNKAAGRWEITGTYFETDKLSGQKTKKTMNRTIPGTYSPDEVRAAFYEMNRVATDATIGSNKVYIATNGSKVK